jgi:peptidoglycan/xylan/chitin deacetylase (PgdA/CDA1 family)
MLKYQKILLASILLLIMMVIIDVFVGINIRWYIGIILATAGLMTYGSLSIRSGFYSRAICAVDSQEKVIALTFDDGPDEQVTPAVLNILRKHEVQAVFFCIGSKVLEYPGLIERIDIEGHIIGGHSYSHHFFFDLFSVKKMQEELVKTEKLVQRVIRRKIRMFRPPYGVTNPALARVLRKMNYKVIGWSLKSKDTVIHDEQKLFERLTKQIRTADIILFHDTSQPMVPVLDKFINFAKEKDYRFARLDKLLQIDAYE